MPGTWQGRRLVGALAAASWLADGGEAPVVKYKVVKRYPHQTSCFTEGLFLNGSEQVFESCGLFGESYLRSYDLTTGETHKQGAVPREIFSEGLVMLKGHLYMLTYKSLQILEFDPHSLNLAPVRHPFPYGEGWGLTTDGCDLLATTGSPYLYRLRPDSAGTPRLVSRVEVTHNGKPVRMLNELEYVTPKLWVNQWHTNTIWRVDPMTGVCEVQLSVSGLHSWRGEQTPNGIAYSPVLGPGHLLVTGKQWPTLFGLQMTPEDLCGGANAKPAPTCSAAPESDCWRPAPTTSTAAPNTTATKAANTTATKAATTAVPTAGALAPLIAAEDQRAAGEVPAPVKPEFIRAGGTLPTGVTVASAVLALALAVAAVAAPVCISSRRHRYRVATQRAEMDGSA